MRFKEIKDMAPAEAQEKLIELRTELMKENAQVAIGTTPKSPGKIKQIKKSIAKLNTLINQKAKKSEEKHQ